MSNRPAYDYIVVGANRLTESGAYRVLLLEAGTEGSNFFWSRVPVGVAKMIDDPAVNWCYSLEPDEGSGGRRIDVPRGRMLGGSSSINGMVFIRGQAQDYDHWAQLGNRGWSYQDVLPIFKRKERYDAARRSFAAAKVCFASPTRRVTRCRCSRSSSRPPPNLTIEQGALAGALILEVSGALACATLSKASSTRRGHRAK